MPGVVLKKIKRCDAAYEKVKNVSKSTKGIMKKVLKSQTKKKYSETQKRTFYGEAQLVMTKYISKTILNNKNEKKVDTKKQLECICEILYDPKKDDEAICKYLKINFQLVCHFSDNEYDKKIELDYQEMILKNKEDVLDEIQKIENDKKYLISFTNRKGETSYFTNEIPIRLIIDYPNNNINVIPKFILKASLIRATQNTSDLTGKQITIFDVETQEDDEFDHIRNIVPDNLIYAWNLEEQL